MLPTPPLYFRPYSIFLRLLEQYQYRTNGRIKTIQNLGIVYYFHLCTKQCSKINLHVYYPVFLPLRKLDLFLHNATYGGLATTGVLKRIIIMIFIL
jgi:hypothetical protein